MLKIQMIFSELITTCPLSGHIKTYYQFRSNFGSVDTAFRSNGDTPHENDASNLPRPNVFG